MRKNKRIAGEKGAAMLISLIFFLFLSLATISGLVLPAVREFKNASASLNSKKSYFLSESGLEDVIYRTREGLALSSSEVLTLDGHSATINVNSSVNTKDVEVLGDVQDYQRKTKIALTTAAGIAFNYGLQAGTGGITMDGGSTLDGNAYSNGDIDAISSTITGSAIAADSASLTADQSNDTPSTPSSSINFRNTSSSQDFAQSFQVSSSDPINKFQFYIRKVGAPSNATVRLVADNNGSPSTTNINTGSMTLSSGLVGSSYGWVEVVVPNTPSLISNTTYWVVIDNSSNNSNNYYVIGANNSYASGVAKTGSYSGSWSNTNLDGYFKIFTGGVTSTIGRATYASGLIVGGDAWASNIKGTSATGSMYCQTGSNNNKSCDTSHGIPPPVALPYSESNIADWKSIAAAGGNISGSSDCPGGSSGGDCNINWQGATFGPGKITGDLNINGGGTLTLTGAVWVEGNVNVNGGGKIRLPAGYALNSETIVADGRVSISGGGSLGSGDPNSYLFIVSTSRCPDDINCSGNSAISVTGGAGAIAVDAQYGNVALSGGASLKAAAGNSLSITGGTTVTYDSGLASPSFQSGPSGEWVLSGWGESE